MHNYIVLKISNCMKHIHVCILLFSFARCLVAAGGKAAGKLDFYQIHTYATNTGNTFNPYSPLVQRKSFFGLNKPVVIGK